jgi:hypothetical protein
MQAKDGCEVDLTGDVANCGACGNACPDVANGSPGCKAMMCGILACKQGFADCDNKVGNGCETNKLTDPRNCGACAVVCAAPNAMPACLNGACRIDVCTPGFADCDMQPNNGCEINLNVDPANCGKCGNVCPNNLPNCKSGVCTGKPRALIVAAQAGNGTQAADIQALLVASGAFGAVDTFDALNATPTVKQLSAYDSALVFCNYGMFADPKALGDNLADFFDAGGQVVLAGLANANFPVLGRYGDPNNGYLLIKPAIANSGQRALGAIAEPNSPLIAGVKFLQCSYGYELPNVLVNGGVTVASWDNGDPLVVRGVHNGRNTVELNLYPAPASKISPENWVGDGGNLLRNALLYR